jgi:hypothetical protein
MRFIPYVIAFMVQLYVIVEAAGTPAPRLMSRWAWVLMSIFVPVLSAILWFVGGRPRRHPDDDARFFSQR